MYTKIERSLKFNKKRDFRLISPCCNKENRDGKFVNYIGYAKDYGYCHSCGKASPPPTIYMDDKGLKYVWNTALHSWERSSEGIVNFSESSFSKKSIKPKKTRFIPEAVIWKYYDTEPENNLLKYLRMNYSKERVDDVKESYVLGTTKNGGTIFWQINKDGNVQKAKISYYNRYGKRTNKFKVPYKNEDGYHSCLYGEHLLINSLKVNGTVILVESEKTAIVGDILLPNYVWLAYGGLNGLTDKKMNCLEGCNVLIIPDISENAVAAIYKKLPQLTQLCRKVRIWDMTEGKTDLQLKQEGIYNNDLEDFIRKLN